MATMQCSGRLAALPCAERLAKSPRIAAAPLQKRASAQPTRRAREQQRLITRAAGGLMGPMGYGPEGGER